MPQIKDSHKNYCEFPQKLVIVATAVAVALVVYLLHTPLHQLFPFIEHDLLTTLCVFVSLIIFTALQRRLSREVKQRVAMSELREIPRFNKVLVGHLNSVVEQTEKAAYDITSHLMTLDAGLTELNQYVNSAVDHSVMAQSKRLEAILMDAVASVQFQDVNRQQIEQVIAGIQRIDTHTTLLADVLQNPVDVAREQLVVPLSEQMEEMFSAYVMEEQRETHRRVLGSEHQKMPASKVELF